MKAIGIALPAARGAVGAEWRTVGGAGEMASQSGAAPRRERISCRTMSDLAPLVAALSRAPERLP